MIARSANVAWPQLRRAGRTSCAGPSRGAAARRGSVTLVVIWAIAIAAVVVAATQVLAWRQAVMGREALARVQARWAARAGVETMISIMEYYREHPVEDDALALVRDLGTNAVGSTGTGDFDIRHFREGIEYAGPMDEHSKLNVNIATKQQMLSIPSMTPDVIDALIDWRDSNDEVEGFGAESDYYANRGVKWRPRNDQFRSFAEIELVAGCWPSMVRGEDWNLNGRLDPNENDGSLSLPDDKPDDYLDAGWSGYLTAYSRGSHMGRSGQTKLYMRTATAQQIQERFGVDQAQAAALASFARSGNAKLETLLVTPLATLAQPANPGSGSRSGSSGRSSGGRNSNQNNQSTQGPPALSTDQLAAIFAEGSMDDPFNPIPGRINLNTVSSEVLQKALGLDGRTADAIVTRRQQKQSGFTSLVDLLEVGELKSETLAQIAPLVDVVSNVYTISSRGRSSSTGTEVELVVVVDASTLPATFLEVREP